MLYAQLAAAAREIIEQVVQASSAGSGRRSKIVSRSTSGLVRHEVRGSERVYVLPGVEIDLARRVLVESRHVAERGVGGAWRRPMRPRPIIPTAFGRLLWPN